MATGNEVIAGDENAQTDTVHDLSLQWIRVGTVDDFPRDGGSAIRYGKSQIAVFRFESRGEWYATQNMCPHKNAFVLSRGIVGDQNGIPKVACPLHKKTYSLESGACLTGENLSLRVFRVKVEEGQVYLELPPEHIIDGELATELHCIGDCTAHADDEVHSDGGAHVNGEAAVAVVG